jgi:hypothetical protein
MSLLKTYAIQCARCDAVYPVTAQSPDGARKAAQADGWQRLAWIFTRTYRDQNTREISGNREDYCPGCSVLVRAEYREIKALEAQNAKA